MYQIRGQIDGVGAGLADGEIVRPTQLKRGLIKKAKLLFFWEVASSYVDALPIGRFNSDDRNVFGKTALDGGNVQVNSDDFFGTPIATCIEFTKNDYGEVNYLNATRELHDRELQEVVRREEFIVTPEGFTKEEFGAFTVVRALRAAVNAHLIQE